MFKKALVTGGCGFIGSNLVKRLVAENWEVLIVDDLSSGHINLLEGLDWAYTMSPSCSPVQVSILSFDDPAVLELVGKHYFDIVFHQAALPRVSYSVEEPLKTMEVNLMGTIQLFKAAADGDTPVVWASSSSVYGGALRMPTHESERGVSIPKSPYAMQKYHCEDYAKLFGELYGLRSIGLRYFNVFGPGQYGDGAYSTAVSSWCHAIKNDEPCRSDGDGEQTRDMCYIDNVVQANIKAANTLLVEKSWNAPANLKSQCYNVACGESVSNNEILAYLKKKFGKRVKVNQAPERAGDVKHTLADISLIKKDLNYEVEVSFWEGLEETLDWWNL